MIIRLYIYIYILINFHSSCQVTGGVFARPMHSTSKFAMTVLSKCVCVYHLCVRVCEPSEEM